MSQTPPAAVVAMMAADAASASLGIELIDCSPGRAVTRMLVRPDMANGYAIAHGGLVFAVADTAFACACNSHGDVTVAAGADITFVARPGSATPWSLRRSSAPGSAAPAFTT